jgi:hypothetical protein
MNRWEKIVYYRDDKRGNGLVVGHRARIITSRPKVINSQSMNPLLLDGLWKGA